MEKAYTTVSEAAADMKKRGFTADFNLQLKKNPALDPSNLVIVEVHRFEGETSSDDEAVVYGIKNNDGEDGILVNGYGISSESAPADFVKKIRLQH